MGTTINTDLAQVARDVSLSIDQVQATVELLDDGNTVPFITRYRKDQTGGLDEEQIRSIGRALEKSRALAERKQKILKSLRSQDKLTDELAALIDGADSLRRLEDIYQPFRPKKQTWASLARSRGLEPLAQEILAAAAGASEVQQRAAEFVNPSQGLAAVDDVLQGAGHLIAECYSENLRLRDQLRRIVKDSGKLISTRIEESAASDEATDAEESEAAEAAEEESATDPLAEEVAAEKPRTEEGVLEQPLNDEPPTGDTPTPGPPPQMAAGEPSAEDAAPHAPPQAPVAAGPVAAEPTTQEVPEELPVGEEPTAPDSTPATELPEAPLAEETAAEETAGAEVADAREESAAAFSESEAESPTAGPRAEAAAPDAVDGPLREGSLEADTAERGTDPRRATPSEEEPADPEALLKNWPSPVAFPTDATFFYASGGKAAPATVGSSEAAAKPLTVASRLTVKQLASKTRKESKKRKRLKKIESFKDYFDYREPLSKLPPHRLLAINRGERSKVLRIKIEVDNRALQARAEQCLIPAEHPHADFLRGCMRDALQRLILPSLEREVRRELTEAAETHAVEVFARNLRKLLLQPPVQNRRVLAIDPGFRSGCKLAALDEFGNVLGHTVIHVIGKEDVVRRGRQQVVEMIQMYHIPIIALGNGTGSRETEKLLADILAHELREQDIRYAIVNEAGASVYSTSAVGRDELPRFDPVLRSAVSIGRRLQDPLSELVKIDPASIGVGLYQHDVKGKHLKESLDAVVESCVNYVGVDVNTASPALLGYVSGLNQLTARRVYEYRQRHGPFRDRNALKKIAGFGDVTFEQAAGFLKIIGGKNPLDATSIHPESYEDAERTIEKLGGDLRELAVTMRAIARKKLPPSTAMQQFARGVLTEPRDSGAPAAGVEVGEERQAEVESPASDGSAREEKGPVLAQAGPEVAEQSVPVEPPVAAETTPAEQPTPAVEAETASDGQLPDPSQEAGEESGTQQPGETADHVQPRDAADVSLGPASDGEGVSEEQAVPETPRESVEVSAQAKTESAEQTESLSHRAAKAEPQRLAAELGIGELLVRDILQSLTRPGRDPREDLPQPLFRREVMKLADLEPGMHLNGTVLNVVDFGAFVDIGLHDSGLVHISRLADRFVRDPHEVVSVGDILNVWVVEVDKQRRRVSLSAIPPGTEKAAPPRERTGGRGRREGRRPGRGERSESRRPDERRGGRAKTGRSMPSKPPQPAKPITPEMAEGKEPMRSFSDLLQFFERKEEPDKRKKKGKK